MKAKAAARSISPLRPGDIPMFLQALLVLPLTAVMLRLGGFKRCHALLERWSRSPAHKTEMWRALAAYGDPETVTRHVLALYEAEPERVRRNVLAFIRDLHAAALLEPVRDL